MDEAKAELLDLVLALIVDVPIVTSEKETGRQPPNYDELGHPVELDPTLARAAYARLEALLEPAVVEEWQNLGAWLSDVHSIALAGHELGHQFAIALGLVDADTERDLAEADTNPVYQPFREDWEPDADADAAQQRDEMAAAVRALRSALSKGEFEGLLSGPGLLIDATELPPLTLDADALNAGELPSADDPVALDAGELPGADEPVGPLPVIDLPGVTLPVIGLPAVEPSAPEPADAPVAALPMPDDPGAEALRFPRARWFAAGGVAVAGFAALALALSALTGPDSASETQPVAGVALTPLPLVDASVATCPGPAESSPPELGDSTPPDAAAIPPPPPRRRAAAGALTDAPIVLRRKGQPDQVVSAVELAPDESPPPGALLLDAAAHAGSSVRVGMKQAAVSIEIE